MTTKTQFLNSNFEQTVTFVKSCWKEKMILLFHTIKAYRSYTPCSSSPSSSISTHMKNIIYYYSGLLHNPSVAKINSHNKVNNNCIYKKEKKYVDENDDVTAFGFDSDVMVLERPIPLVFISGEGLSATM